MLPVYIFYDLRQLFSCTKRYNHKKLYQLKHKIKNKRTKKKKEKTELQSQTHNLHSQQQIIYGRICTSRTTYNIKKNLISTTLQHFFEYFSRGFKLVASLPSQSTKQRKLKKKKSFFFLQRTYQVIKKKLKLLASMWI